jgi:hypothetical protein
MHWRAPLRALTLAGLAVVASFVFAVPAAHAAESANSQASEMVRLFNGIRWAEGKASLRVDPYLAKLASDGEIACPDDGSQYAAGRARDFATFDYLSHQLRLCGLEDVQLSDVLFVNTMGPSYGYWNVGEIDLVNGGYGTARFLLSWSGAKDRTWSTWTYATTGHGVLGWMNSASHRAVVLGTYDRVGCGAWIGRGKYYYDCIFARGGSSPSGTVAATTKPPFPDAVPGATEVPPKKTDPTRRPTVAITPKPVVRAPVARTTTGTGVSAPVVSATPALGAQGYRGAVGVAGPQGESGEQSVQGAQVVGASSAPTGPEAGTAGPAFGFGLGGGPSLALAELIGLASGMVAGFLALSAGGLFLVRRRRPDRLG